MSLRQDDRVPSDIYDDEGMPTFPWNGYGVKRRFLVGAKTWDLWEGISNEKSRKGYNPYKVAYDSIESSASGGTSELIENWSWDE